MTWVRPTVWDLIYEILRTHWKCLWDASFISRETDYSFDSESLYFIEPGSKGLIQYRLDLTLGWV